MHMRPDHVGKWDAHGVVHLLAAVLCLPDLGSQNAQGSWCVLVGPERYLSE